MGYIDSVREQVGLIWNKMTPPVPYRIEWAYGWEEVKVDNPDDFPDMVNTNLPAVCSVMLQRIYQLTAILLDKWSTLRHLALDFVDAYNATRRLSRRSIISLHARFSTFCSAMCGRVNHSKRISICHIFIRWRLRRKRDML